jgi:flap endonuclease-1
MGTGIRPILKPIKTATLENFLGKTICVDAFNAIYQFLSIIRDRRGKPLTNTKGKITSHLIGALYRNTKIMEHNIKLIYVFDGPFKSEKLRWQNKSKEKKVRITETILNSIKRLLKYMGVPYVQAPSEGESQCAHIVNQGDAWSVASQDYDCLLFNSPRTIRNLSVSGKEDPIEYINLKKVLESLHLDLFQLRSISFLIGNDWFPGIYGFGPKTAIKKIKKHGSIDNMSFDEIFLTKDKKEIDKDILLQEFRQNEKLFSEPKVKDDYKLRKNVDLDKLREFLLNNDFSKTRVDNSIKRLRKIHFSKKQTNILNYLT